MELCNQRSCSIPLEIVQIQGFHVYTTFNYIFIGRMRNNVVVEGIDYYFEPGGRMVFTEEYHLRRGYCCNGRCRHCPYRKPIQFDHIDIVYEKCRNDAPEPRPDDDK